MSQTTHTTASSASAFDLEQTMELMSAAGIPESHCRLAYAGHGLTLQIEHLRDIANAARRAAISSSAVEDEKAPGADPEFMKFWRADHRPTINNIWSISNVVVHYIWKAGYRTALTRDATTPPGYKLVPLKCTPEMRAAWDRAPCNEDDDVEFGGAYAAMLAAAPGRATTATADAWHDAVLAECMKVEAAYHADDPARTLKELIDWHAHGSDIASTNKTLADNYLKLTCGSPERATTAGQQAGADLVAAMRDRVARIRHIDESSRKLLIQAADFIESRATPAATTASARCEECAGSGKIGPDDNPNEMDCEVCGGSGREATTAGAGQGEKA